MLIVDIGQIYEKSVILIQIFSQMQRKTNNSVEEVVPRQMCQRLPGTVTSLQPNSMAYKGPSQQQNMVVMDKNCQYSKVVSYQPTNNYLAPQSLKPHTAPRPLAKSTIMPQQEITPFNFTKPTTTTENGSYSFLPPPLTSNDLTHKKSDPSQRNLGHLLKKSEIIEPVYQPPSISRLDSGNSPHLTKTPTMFKQENKNSSREDRNTEDLEICQFLKKGKNKLLSSMIMEQPKPQNKNILVSPLSKQAEKEVASTIPSQHPSNTPTSGSKIKRPTMWPINVTPLEKKSYQQDQLMFRKQKQEIELDQCEKKIQEFQTKNRLSAPLPRKRGKQWKLQDFQVVQKIGKGAYGDVFLAQQKKTSFLCVIKTISKQKIKDQKLEQHIFREIKLQLYMNHRHLTSLFGFFHDENKIYLIMQYLSDGNLSHVYRKKKIPEPKVSKIVRQVCQGLFYMHREQIIHRDIKPENLFVHEDYIKIGDFGCAIFSNTLRKTVVGCLAYISPEQLANGFYDDKIDVWSVGILTYQLLTGKPPFQQDIIKIARNEKEPKLSQLNFPDNISLSEDAINFIQSLLKEDPNERMEMRNALKHPFITKHREAE